MSSNQATASVEPEPKAPNRKFYTEVSGMFDASWLADDLPARPITAENSLSIPRGKPKLESSRSFSTWAATGEDLSDPLS